MDAGSVETLYGCNRLWRPPKTAFGGRPEHVAGRVDTGFDADGQISAKMSMISTQPRRVGKFLTAQQTEAPGIASINRQERPGTGQERAVACLEARLPVLKRRAFQRTACIFWARTGPSRPSDSRAAGSNPKEKRRTVRESGFEPANALALLVNKIDSLLKRQSLLRAPRLIRLNRQRMLCVRNTVG